MGPLGMSAKQHREYLKLQSQEQREAAKMERDESRKNQLHEIKLQEAAVKANQGIGHKEDLHAVKLQELVSPLGKPPKINREKMGLPSINPMAGMDVFKQGQHKMYAQGTAMVPNGTDTVPAMLTPGEAVIPATAAQNPKNKKTIQKMVQEGRQKNKLRDGTATVVKSDNMYSEGTEEVPSLAYRHPDVPGSSFSNGTYGVVPQQVQQAAGYFEGTVGASEGDLNKEVPQPVEVTPIPDQVNISQITSIPEQPANTQSEPVTPIIETPTVEVPKPATIDASNMPVQEPGTTQTQEIPAVPQPTLDQTKTNVLNAIAPNAQPTAKEPIFNPAGQETPYDPATATRREDYQESARYASNKIRNVADYVEELGGKHKDEKSFTDALVNLFTAQGFKEELGFNNQDIIRMAISTAVGSRRYGFNRALSFAGRQAFEESNKRQAQEQANQKAIRTAAVQMRRDDIRDARAEENAWNKEQRDNLREDARREHDQFIASIQLQRDEARREWEATKDNNRYIQQNALLDKRLAHAQSIHDQTMTALDNRAAIREQNKPRELVSPDGTFFRGTPVKGGYVTESGSFVASQGVQDATAHKANIDAVKDQAQAYYPKNPEMQSAAVTAYRQINTSRVDPIGSEAFGNLFRDAVKKLKANGISNPDSQELKMAIQLLSVPISNADSAINRVVVGGNLKVGANTLDYKTSLDNAEHYSKVAKEQGLDPSKFVQGLEFKYNELKKNPAAIRELHNMTTSTSGNPQSPIYTLSRLTPGEIEKLGTGKLSDKKITQP